MVNLSNLITYIKQSIEETLGFINIVILVVDINIDTLNFTGNHLRDCLTLLRLLISNFINEPLRITKNRVELIDPVIVSSTCDILDTGVIPVDRHVCDHTATYVSVRIKLHMSNNFYRGV